MPARKRQSARETRVRASLDSAPAGFPHWPQPCSGVIKALIEIC